MPVHAQRSAPLPIPPLRGRQAYAPPKHPAPVDLLLAGNEGDRPAPEWLADLVPRAVDLLRSYPSAKQLERRLAERAGVRPEQVIVTAGGDEAIDRLCRAYLAPGRRAVVPQPTFVMFPHYVQLTGCELDTVAWPDGPYPLDAVLAALRPETSMVTIVTPNNPSGAVATASDIERVANAAPQAIVVVDQAYVEYADEDFTALALAFPNCVVVRTLSKAWGLAGLRCGYALGDPAVIATLRAAGGPFSVSGLTLAVAEQALQAGAERSQAHVARVRSERTALVRLLGELGVDAPPSQGNFVLARSPRVVWLRDALAALGIAVRIFPGEPGLADCARITCPGDALGFARLEHALRSALAPQAMLFDMDGVLADVSGSYRRAIAETAASFGVAVSARDIADAKAEGNANNDWVLTWRLVKARGVQVDLATVTVRFESLYQGTPGEPGLYRHETMLPSRAWLEQLGARYPLGVVTGRPRADAQRWLRDHRLEGLFAVVVCLEDAPLKPDPAPVRLALQRHGVTRAWLFGDTPDDVRAARSAGVVPVGVGTAVEEFERSQETLLRAGAARVVKTLAEIDEVFG